MLHFHTAILKRRARIICLKIKSFCKQPAYGNISPPSSFRRNPFHFLRPPGRLTAFRYPQGRGGVTGTAATQRQLIAAEKRTGSGTGPGAASRLPERALPRQRGRRRARRQQRREAGGGRQGREGLTRRQSPQPRGFPRPVLG